MILISLGANLPFRAQSPVQTLHDALVTLSDNGITPVKVSRFYETLAWPNPSDPAFVNAVAVVETLHSPAMLIRTLHEIEFMFGRVRTAPNAPRTLDLDIIDYDGRTEAGPPELPHPRIAGRGFVLVPLAEIAPAWRHPVSGKSVEQFLSELPPEARTLKPLEMP